MWMGVGLQSEYLHLERFKQGYVPYLCHSCPRLTLKDDRGFEESKIGFDLHYQSSGQLVEHRILQLMFADNMVWLDDLRKLANICGEEATYRGLNFSLQKSGVMVFSDEANNTTADSTGSCTFGKAV